MMVMKLQPVLGAMLTTLSYFEGVWAHLALGGVGFSSEAKP